MLEIEVCRQIFEFVAKNGRVQSSSVMDELSHFDRKTVQSGMHALMRSGLLDREKKEQFEYFIPSGVSEEEMLSIFNTGSDFADIAALSPVPESGRNKGVVRRTPEEIRRESIEKARRTGDLILERLEKISLSARKASNSYAGGDGFVKSVLEEAAQRSEEALSAYCDKLSR